MNRPYLSLALSFFTALSLLRGQDSDSYQRRAATALQFETAQMGKDCGEAKTTPEINSCMFGVEEKTNTNFNTFYEALRSLLTPDSDAARQLDSSQELWAKYSASACDAIDAFYRSGSIRVSAVTGCRIQLTRSRMQDLNALYYISLHL
jgi:uncharacterized protein YecT (DUF1311 family)